MTKSQRRRSVEAEAEVVEVQTPPKEQATELTSNESPLFGVAMLKIALELKKPNAGELDDILSGVLRRMNLSEASFRSYMRRNGGLLRAIASKRQG